MANPFRQRSRFRKLVYFGLILALFTVSLLHRRFLIEPEAMALQLREQSRGEVELTSSAVRLTLVGSRGIATCGLWWAAKEKQRKQQWNELELVVRSITKLQPHFTAPWRFLSWNLAFNVAVECDRARDKYFYVSRGLELLAEGERRNQGTQEEGAAGRALRFPGNPDMRYDLGFFYQLKINESDDKHFMRCLFDLSCIDPVKRDPARFWGVDPKNQNRRAIKTEELEAFCRENPRLVRRLREHLGRAQPREVVGFLEDNGDVPSRFDRPPPGSGATESPLKRPRDQWPVLPYPDPLPPNLPDPARRAFAVAFDVSHAAHAWYVYAQEPLPPPDPDDAVRERPFDAVHHRLPTMSTMIFRSYPPRALSYAAEALEQEGFFDARQGWTLPARWLEARRRGPAVVVGTEPKYHAAPAWDRAYRAYLEFAQKNGLYYEARQRRRLEEQAAPYLAALGSGVAPGRPPRQRTGPVARGYEAFKRSQWSDFYVTLTNVGSFLNEAAVERRPEAVAARKQFFQARELVALAQRDRAVRTYKEALDRWEDLLLANPEFRRVPDVQREAYEQQRKYLRLRQELDRGRLAPLVLAVAEFGMVGPAAAPEGALNLPRLLQAEPGEAVAFDPALVNTVLPLRQFLGRFEMLRVFNVRPIGADELGLEDLLLTLAEETSPAPLVSALAMTRYQRDRMLVAWDAGGAAAAPAQRPDQVSLVRWEPFLGDEAARHLLGRAGRTGPAPNPIARPAAAGPAGP